jgi:hypothetical protein
MSSAKGCVMARRRRNGGGVGVRLGLDYERYATWHVCLDGCGFFVLMTVVAASWRVGAEAEGSSSS